MVLSLASAKDELRKRIKTILKGLPEAVTASQTTSAINTLLSMPEYKSAQRISIYLSMPAGEISTSFVVREALQAGKKVFVPYTHTIKSPQPGKPTSIMDMLELHSIEDFNSLEPDKWKIPTPSKTSLTSRANCFGGQGVTDSYFEGQGAGLDLIVMPGIAFDSHFGRLGHGKGYYDYFLSRCYHISQMPFRVGLSLTEQFLANESVPMGSSDFRLDATITGDGKLRRAET